ncbi:MAG: (Fe-S)-binding protein, partial [Candidatus Omnitrophota bacterium]
MQILAPILTLTLLGLFFGIVIAFAAKKFAVIQDPKIQEILENLPNANCGACGLAGCANFAEVLVKGDTTLSNCRACSEEQAAGIAAILGVAYSAAEKQVAVLHCYGGSKAKDRFAYQGIADCQAAAQLMGGYKLCSYACLGLGNCARACPFKAITIDVETNLPVVDAHLCTGCGQCLAACPRKLITLVSRQLKRSKIKDKRIYVGCSSLDTARVVMNVCAAGC